MKGGAESLKAALRAADPQGSYEVELQGAWSRIPLERELPLADGRLFVALSTGTWNVEAGPDFLNARILIGGRVVKGAVEIHRKASDWLRHGHQKDPAYASVVLHVVEEDDRRNPGSAPDLPTFVIRPSGQDEGAPVPKKGLCARNFSSLSTESLQAIFSDAGLERLSEKAEDALGKMIAGGESLAYLSKLFDVAGYKANRAPFAETLRRFLSHPQTERESGLEALLFGESGLLPDPSQTQMEPEAMDKAKKLWARWWPLRKQHAEPVQWSRGASRPMNSPERRLAAVRMLLTRFGESPLDLFAGKLRSMSATDFNDYLEDALSGGDAFWDARSSFTSAKLQRPGAIAGQSLALELAANLIFPCLLAKARLSKDKELEALALSAYRTLPGPESNRILKNALTRWFMEPAKAEKALSGAACRQGAMHIYASYCDKIAADCKACLLFNSI